jgi:ribonuclease BN (tRNA processing enzyme)
LGGVKLTIVGCSGSVPGPEAGCSCYLVEHKGFRLMLDHGSGSCGPLMRYTAPESIGQIFISHGHADLVSPAYHRGRAGAKPARLIGPGDLPSLVTWPTRETELYTYEAAVAGTTDAAR